MKGVAMFAQAINKFQELSTTDAYKPNGYKSIGGGQLCDPSQVTTSIDNVWCWCPSDVEDITVVNLPDVGCCYVIYEKRFGSNVGGIPRTTQTFLCDSQKSLDNCYNIITNNFLL